MYMIFPQHKTHAGYLVCISDLGGGSQGNGSARILCEANTELKLGKPHLEVEILKFAKSNFFWVYAQEQDVIGIYPRSTDA